VSRKKQKFQAREPQQPDTMEASAVESFSFGDPIAVTDRNMFYDLMECSDNGVWFEPPISPCLIQLLITSRR